MARRLHGQKVGGIGLVDFGNLELLRFAQRQPTAHPHVIEHLQQPFDLRRAESEVNAGSEFAKPRGFIEHRQDLPAILPALFGERFFEQALVFSVGRAVAGSAELMVRRRNEGIKLQDLKQEGLLPFAQCEGETILFRTDEFDDSRSMVACRVYFWSWCA